MQRFSSQAALPPFSAMRAISGGLPDIAAASRFQRRFRFILHFDCITTLRESLQILIGLPHTLHFTAFHTEYLNIILQYLFLTILNTMPHNDTVISTIRAFRFHLIYTAYQPIEKTFKIASHRSHMCFNGLSVEHRAQPLPRINNTAAPTAQVALSSLFSPYARQFCLPLRPLRRLSPRRRLPPFFACPAPIQKGFMRLVFNRDSFHT